MKNRTSDTIFNGENYRITSTCVEFGYQYARGSLKWEYKKYIERLYAKQNRKN